MDVSVQSGDSDQTILRKIVDRLFVVIPGANPELQSINSDGKNRLLRKWLQLFQAAK